MKLDEAPIVGTPILRHAGSTSANMVADVRFELVDGSTIVSKCRAGNPLKLMTPRQRDVSAWVIAATFGGGLLAGDEINLHVTAAANARGMIGTQASTKIFRSDSGATSRQTLHATIETGALLAVLPDPIAPFAGAKYEQQQRFDLSPGGSLVLLDSFTAGRLARGERWAMERYRSTSEVFIDGKRVARDALLLDNAAGAIDGPFRVGRFNAFATMMAFGPMVAGPVEQLIASVRSRKIEKVGDLLITASPVAGGAIVRVAGVEIEQVTHAARDLLAFVTPLLGESPWARKW